MTKIKSNPTTPIVRSLLAQRHALYERQFKGDYDAVCALVDLDRAIALAGLTERQAEALMLVYGEDLTQASAGERMGISQQAVDIALDAAITKIQRIYDEWETI